MIRLVPTKTLIVDLERVKYLNHPPRRSQLMAGESLGIFRPVTFLLWSKEGYNSVTVMDERSSYHFRKVHYLPSPKVYKNAM